jgi:hypothetical protein
MVRLITARSVQSTRCARRIRDGIGIRIGIRIGIPVRARLRGAL